jgi:Family of unknown function (DUF5706)
MELLEQPKPSTSGLPTVEDLELDTCYRTLDRVVGNISSADNKALIALTFQGAVVAGLIIIADALSKVSHSSKVGIEIAILLAVTAFFVCLCWSTLKLFQTISPRIAPPHSAEHISELFYFGGIVNMGHDDFQVRMRDLTIEQVHEAVTHITWVQAHIVQAKYKNLRHAFLGLGLQVVLFVIVVALTGFVL